MRAVEFLSDSKRRAQSSVLFDFSALGFGLRSGGGEWLGLSHLDRLF